MCVIQGWVLGFNPNSPKGMKIPIWVTLKKLPIEFRARIGWEITASNFDNLLGFDKDAI
jgi:hypothetical protein